MNLNDKPIWDPENPALKDLLRQHPEWLKDSNMRNVLKDLSGQGDNDWSKIGVSKPEYRIAHSDFRIPSYASKPSIPQIKLTPQLKRFYLMFFCGLALTVWVWIRVGSFNTNLPLFSQPHWWLLIPLYVASPRLLAFYYLLCGKPTIGHPLEILLLGVVLAPRAWGLYALPGLSVALPIRLVLALAGHCAFQIIVPLAVSRDSFNANIGGVAANFKRLYDQMNCDIDDSTSRRIAATIVLMWMIIPGLVGVGWLYVRNQSEVIATGVATAKTEIRVREEMAQAAGYTSYDEWREAVCTPVLRFEPGASVRPSPEGYLISDSYIPLRAIASRPNVSVFEGYEFVSPGSASGVIGVMKCWYPYFVFETKEKAIAIGETLSTRPEARRWIPISHCFCWTTRECLSIEKERLTYRTLKDAKEDEAGTRGERYRYPFFEHFEKDPARKDIAAYRMAALPVLDRQDSIYWCIAKPEGGAGGYQVSWIKWDGRDDSVVLRFRTTRQEYSRYINGLWGLRTNIREKEGKLLGKAVDWVTSAELSDRSDHATTRKRLEGVPLIGGFWLEPPETIEQFGRLKKLLDTALRVDSSEEVWDCTDTAYLTPDLVY